MGGIIRDLMCKGRLKRFQTTFVSVRTTGYLFFSIPKPPQFAIMPSFIKPQYHTLKDKKWVFCKVKKS